MLSGYNYDYNYDYFSRCLGLIQTFVQHSPSSSLVLVSKTLKYFGRDIYALRETYLCFTVISLVYLQDHIYFAHLNYYAVLLFVSAKL